MAEFEKYGRSAEQFWRAYQVPGTGVAMSINGIQKSLRTARKASDDSLAAQAASLKQSHPSAFCYRIGQSEVMCQTPKGIAKRFKKLST